MSDVAIRVENLSKSYRITHSGAITLYRTLQEDLLDLPRRLLSRVRQGGRETFWALHDVSLEVRQGEVLGIIGRNGAGKSTLLKILSRITLPTSGRAEIYGRVGSLLEVGTGFHPELTGRENIYLSGAILGMRRKEIDRQLDTIVDFAEVEQFLDTPVKRYSSGMYARLAFAVAAHLDTEILIVDEVLAVGDSAFQKKCLGKMGDVARREGRTVLFVSHNMSAIQRLCSECKLLEAGEIRAQGSPVTVIADYLSLALGGASPGPTGAMNSGQDITWRVLDEEGSETRTWRYGEKLTVEVSVSTATALYRPAIDMAFYSDGQVRLFALQSDKLGEGPEVMKGSWTVRFLIDNPGFTAPEIYFDLGLRERNDPYLFLFRDAGRLFCDYTTVPDAALTDCILYPRVEYRSEVVNES
ncbi:MAG TPA: polysaccharide ABC transporter ATP-binding protein [Chloroflexia bacterium]|nr:polysaccharide ABC transporter ATP-binding protein [Chloroflexia bacterium]